jgi:hypothetical protein
VNATPAACLLVLLALVIAGVLVSARGEVRTRGRARAGAPAGHPATRVQRPARRTPGLPGDGRPLTTAEQRALFAIGMDAFIDVPEPDYTPRGRA